MKREQLEYKIIDSISAYEDRSVEKLSKYLSKSNRFSPRNVSIDLQTTLHDFETNRFHQGQKLCCVFCGTKAKVIPLILGVKKAKVISGQTICPIDQNYIAKNLSSREGVKIQLVSNLSLNFGIGLEKWSNHTCVKCPDEHLEKYVSCYWIDSERGPIRLLNDEFIVL